MRSASSSSLAQLRAGCVGKREASGMRSWRIVTPADDRPGFSFNGVDMNNCVGLTTAVRKAKST